MSSRIRNCFLFCVVTFMTGAVDTISAQQPPGTIGQGQANLEEIMKSVEGALPPMVGSPELAQRLLDVKLAPPLSETFSLAVATRAVFGRSQPVFAPDCSRVGTPANEPDQGQCNASVGTPSGEGKFSQLSFSKNLGFGNIRFLSRSAFNPNFVPTDLKEVTLSDVAALNRATEFLSKSFGLPTTEFPLPPPSLLNASTQMPFVSNLAVAGQSIQGEAVRPMVIQKLVSIPRGLRVDLQDPASGRSLPFVPAPGVAKVLFEASGIASVMVENWQELKVDPTLAARNAKSRNELISEIAQDLFADGGARIANVSAHIVYGSDWRGTFCYLVPAVRVYVAPAVGNLNNDQLKQILDEKIGTAGIVREYALIGRPDFTVPGR